MEAAVELKLMKRNGHREVVQLLLQSGAEIEEKSNVSGQQSRQTYLLYL